ncbi:MAG: hypothetical protein HY319_21325 [Armatimonadetes bacterium]|nr:hypothetical protein [Armatimonadota bacterium]
MSLDLYVGESGGEYRVAELPVLLRNLEVYGHGVAGFPLLQEMVTSVDGSFNPVAVLEETRRLIALLSMERPYIQPSGGLSGSDLQGMRYHPEELRPTGQFVISWTRLAAESGESRLVETDPPCSLIADSDRLHLVEATLPQLADQPWDSFYCVSGRHFRWSEGLWVDGEPLETTPRSFRLDCHRWGEVVHAAVPIGVAWEREIAELRRACKEAIELRLPLEASI